MKYSELLELYKKNELHGEELEQVKKDIERQEAISEFLFEEENDEFLEMEIPVEQGTEFSKEADEFTRKINRSIRKAFIKMGTIVAIVAIAATLFVILALPQIVDQFYYNPGKSVGENGNQLSLDLAVYTEVTMPGYNRDNVRVVSNGYGNYDIYIYQNVSYTGTITNVAGELDKGNLILYDPNVLRRPTGNAFAWFQMEGDSRDSLTTLINEEGKTNYCAAGETDWAVDSLLDLEENKEYLAYVTLDRMMPYEDFMEYLEQSYASETMANLWCAVCTENGVADVDASKNGEVSEEGWARMEMFRATNLGFNCTLTSSKALDWDRETYPLLLLWDEQSIDSGEADDIDEKMRTEEYMKTHFISMLRYLAEQEQFLEMMGERKEEYVTAAEYVEENGIMVYGYAGIAEKDDLLTLVKEEEVFEIYTQEMR